MYIGLSTKTDPKPKFNPNHHLNSSPSPHHIAVKVILDVGSQVTNVHGQMIVGRYAGGEVCVGMRERTVGKHGIGLSRTHCDPASRAHVSSLLGGPAALALSLFLQPLLLLT